MSKLTDRVSFLKGLAEGMQIDKEKSSNKLLLEIISVLDDMAKEIADMSDAHDELNEYVESIDDDLADLEDVLFGDEDEDGCGCDCEGCDGEDCDAEDEEDEEDGEMISYSCPHCGHEIQFDADSVDFDEEYLCPACGKPVFPEVSEDGDENE